MEPILKAEHIYKEFGATKALTDVSMVLYPGEVRGLIGENGSGKSTMSNMIAGVHEKTKGHLFFQGSEFHPKSILNSKKQGICLLAQETGTITGMTVYENMFLGEEAFGNQILVNIRKLQKECRKILEENGLAYMNPEDNVEKYSFEDRKMLEVARAVHHNPLILIVDETTTALSGRGRQKIYEIIRSMKQKGKSVIFISHDLDEIMNVCDSVTVLRDGHYIDTLQKEQLSKDSLRSLMIGRELNGSYYRTDQTSDYHLEVVLKAEKICYKNILTNVSLELHKGEILGIGGLTESGMHELCKIMFGALEPDSGKVIYQGNTLITSPSIALQKRIAYIPKDRDTESIFISADIQDNIAAASYDKIKKGFFIFPKYEKALAECNAADLEIKMKHVSQSVNKLSGGNKQKVAISKWLANDSEIFLMDCPTRGIDIGVKAGIYSLMQKLKHEGKSILMVSEELTELIGMSDRILILNNGKMAGQFKREDKPTERKMIELML